MGLKSEFEKAFEAKFGVNQAYYAMLDAAYFGATWMAKRFAKEAIDSESGVLGASQIRQLSKELEGAPE